MTEFKGTPGPWYAEPANDGTFGLYARTEQFGTQLLGEFYSEDMGDELPAIDNLRLAASAPALLGALEEMEARFGHVACLQVGKARAAIASALGADK